VSLIHRQRDRCRRRVAVLVNVKNHPVGGYSQLLDGIVDNADIRLVKKAE
jgi:hypothetical protein